MNRLVATVLLGLALWLAVPQKALAADYKFPGQMPPGCAKTSGVANGDYTCGALTLAYQDTITINGKRPAVLRINGAFNTDTSAINADGSASDLRIIVSGTLTPGYQANLHADISAASVAGGGATRVTWGGSVSTTGALQIGEQNNIAGQLSSTAGAITIGQDSTVGGDVSSSGGGSISVGYASQVGGAVSTSAAITLAQNAVVRGAISGGSGAVGIGYAARVEGAVSTSAGAITLAQNAQALACVQSGNGSSAIQIGYQAQVAKVCCGALGSCGSSCVQNSSTYAMPSLCSAAVATLHHLELQHASGSGLTCTPSTITIKACQDAACSSLYTGGVTGSLSASGGSVAWPDGAGFSIAAGSSSGTLRLQATTTTAALLGTASSTPAAANATSCNFGSPSCSFSAADAGLLFDVPNHVSELVQTISVSAVRKSDNSTACTPAFTSTSKAINFRCSHSNPASGTLPVRVAGTALNSGASTAAACDAGGRSLTLAFNASGVASTTVQYADVGQLQLSATYTGSAGTGDSGLVMSGSDSFIAAPAAFAFSAITAGPIRAGAAFSATLSVRNSAGGTTPNFGRESVPAQVQLDFSRHQPSGAGAQDGNLSGNFGAFSNGVASSSSLAWSEVGRIDLQASLVGGSYLGSGFSASGSTGSTGAVGRFIPHHFDITLAPACGSFSYAGQPFSATVTARNADNDTTANYDGSASTSPNFAQAVALAEPSALGLGTLSGHSLPASAFSAGVASASPAYAFSSKTTAPQSLVLRASDADGASSSGFAEPAMALRSGRLRLRNAFGQASAALQLPVVAEYWAGNTWQLNSADSCTSLAGASVALSNARSASGAATAAGSSAGALAISSGSGSITLAAPSPAGSSLSLDIALNLGSGNADQSCNSSHPASSGAAKPWLRALNGSCAASADRDPAARASFGIFSPESRRTVHVRDLF